MFNRSTRNTVQLADKFESLIDFSFVHNVHKGFVAGDVPVWTIVLVDTANPTSLSYDSKPARDADYALIAKAMS